MEAMKTAVVVGERPDAGEGLSLEEGRGEGALTPALSQGEREEDTPSPALPHEARGRAGEKNEMRQEERQEEQEKKEQEQQEEEREADSPGSPAEAADEVEAGSSEVSDGLDWRGRAEAAEERVAELGDRLGAVEAAAEDLRLIVGESERARQVDRELLIAGVVDLNGARSLVDEQIATGATVLEAVSRVKERRPLLFAARARGIRATVLPAVEGERSRSVDEVAEAARETGDRRLLLRYLRMRRGEG